MPRSPSRSKDLLVRVRLDALYGYLRVNNDKVIIEPGELYADGLSKPFLFSMKTKSKKKATYFLKHNASQKYLAMPHLGHTVTLSSERFEMSLLDMKSPVWKFVGHKSRNNLPMVSSPNRVLEICDPNSKQSYLSFEIVPVKEITQRRGHSPSDPEARMKDKRKSLSSNSSIEYNHVSHSLPSSSVLSKSPSLDSLAQWITTTAYGSRKYQDTGVMIGSFRTLPYRGEFSREESSVMLSPHLHFTNLLFQIDAFLVASPTRYKQLWIGIDKNFILSVKTQTGEVSPIMDIVTCKPIVGARRWVGTCGCHLFHFMLSSLAGDFEFAVPEETGLQRLLNLIHKSQEFEREKIPPELAQMKKENIWLKTGGGMAVWGKKPVVVDGCVIAELPNVPPKDSGDVILSGGGGSLGSLGNLVESDTSTLLKRIFINLLDVSSITIPSNSSEKKYQLRITSKNGLFKMAFDTEKQLTEWMSNVESLRQQLVETRTPKSSEKEELHEEEMMEENPLARKCREEEAQWGIHYNVHHHLLQCCVFGEVDMINYLVRTRGADVEHVLPHMPEGNTFFDIGDTALKVGYRFDRPEVISLVQQYIDHSELEEEESEKIGDYSKSFGPALPVCTPITSRNRSRTVTSSLPTQFREYIADYSDITLTDKKKSSGFFEDRMIPGVPVPEWVTLIPAVLFDARGLPRLDVLRSHFHQEGRLAISCVHRIIRCAKKLIRKEPNVIYLDAPVNVFGDIHGQFYDLLTQLEKLDVPSDGNFEQCLFLGDYVDRGMFSCEVVLYLLCLKIRFPNKIYLLRGNHETRNLTEFFNFRIECLRKYNRLIYAMLMDLFDYLPLASIITNKQGRFFCLHGGLSPSLQFIEEIDRIHRIEEVPETGPMCDLLWCDPYRADAYPEESSQPDGESEEGFDGWDSDDSEEEVVVQTTLKAPSATGGDIRFIGNHVRGSGYIFGGAASEPFLMDNKLLMIVRAHEVMNEGYLEYYFGRNDRQHPQVITIFSAPNYCDMYGNDAAVMRIKEDRYEYMITKAVEHPYYLPDLTNAIHYTFPYIMENLSELMYGAVMFFVAPREDDEEEEKKDVDAKTLTRLDSLHSMRHYSMKARMNNEKSMVEAKATEAVGRLGPGGGRFANARSFDMANDKNPLTVSGGRNSVRSISRLKGLMILDQMKQQQQKKNQEKQQKVKTPSLASLSVKRELGTSHNSRDRSFTVSSSLLPLPAPKEQ